MVRKLLFGSASAFAALAAWAPAFAQETTVEEEIVVTGVRASLVQGLENKRDATQIIESIVAEDIGKLPDINVVEALQRVTGVQITDRGGGEADAVFIRGLPDITTTWNGRFIFTASGRQLALQDIPANLVNRIDVYKTRAAEQLETGIAGQVDVFTRRPFDFDGFQFSMNARSTYQEQRDSYDPNVSALISDTWDIGAGRLGALVNVSFVQTRFRDQSVTAGALVPFATADNPPPGFVPLERIFSGWQAGTDRGLPTEPGSTLTFNGEEFPYLLARDALFASDFRGDRYRPAMNAALQFSPNDSATYTFEFFYQGFRQELFNNLHFTFADWWGSLGPNPADTITLYPGTNLIRTRTVGFPFGFNSGDSTEQNTDSFVYALNGKWEIGDRFDLVADLAFQESEFETDFIAVRTERVPQSITLDFNSGDGIPSWHFNDDSEMLDPTVWTVGGLFQNAGRANGDAVTFSADGDYDFAGGGDGFLQTLSFGIRYDDRGASEEQPLNSPTPFLGQPMSALPQAFQWRNDNFFDGGADVPRSWLVANGYWIRDNADLVRSLYGVPTGDLPLVEAFSVDETTMSAYLQTDLEAKIVDRPLRMQAGVRYVNVETEMDFTDLVSPTLEESSASKKVDVFLPSVTIRYDVTEDFRIRFNYGETLRRPTFIDLNPNFDLTEDLTMVGYGTGTGGNPDLEATQAKNYDLAAEWYFAPDSALYATVFRREIEGLVVPLTRRLTIPGTGLNTDTFVVTQPVNASDGVLEGVEIGFVHFPTYLPGILDGLGVQASLTKLDSSQNIPQTNPEGEIIGQEQSSFFVVSDLSYNVTLAYDRAGLGMRLSYVWRDDFLRQNEARLFANPIGIWRKPESSLDFQATYALNDKLAFTFDAVNLTEELQQSYYAFADAGGPDMFNFGSTLISRSFALGLQYSFN